jgi:hypothetical protein
MSPETNAEDQSGKFVLARFLSEGILIGSVSVLFYFSAFLYELGYCNYFGVPGYLIEIGVSNILTFAYGMRLYIGVFMLLSFGYFGLSKIDSSPYDVMAYVPAAKAVINILLVYQLFLILGLPDEDVELARESMLFIFGVVFLLPVLYFRVFREESVRISFLKCNDLHNELIDSIQALKAMREDFVLNPVEVIALYLYFIGLSYGAGRAEAINQQYYLSLKENPNMIVLRKYGDQLVVREYDILRGIIQEGLHLIKISEKDQIELIFRNRGSIGSPGFDRR